MNIESYKPAFRIWDKQSNCFVSQYEKQKRQNRIKHFIDAKGDIGKIWYGLIEGSSEDNIVDPSIYVIQRSTGCLSDKGKLIYEGDIIKFKYTVGDFAWEYMKKEERQYQEKMHSKDFVGTIVSDCLTPCNLNIMSNEKYGYMLFPLLYARKSKVVGHIFKKK
jgi:hypothetical protein